MKATVLPPLLLAFAPLAQSAPVLWTDWTQSSPGLVNGTVAAPGGAIDVTAAGTWTFVQTSGGTNYWTPVSTFTSATVDNAPPASDMIALNTGGTETITFSKPVVDPLVALVSWNGNTVEFNTPIEVVKVGQGVFGSGTPVLNAAGTGFFGNGEVHGVLRLPGTFTSISFSHTSEFWHGFTVGITGAVPEPDSRLLLAAALPLVALALRRRRQI